ncbi:MAG: hypothetical protein K0U13_04225 [Chlamydiae bacterium]|nr:hypothetical protein [Chlamydiota bacterium]
MIELAISPCPNDTFLFAPWALGLVAEPPKIHFADIQQLNEWALQGRYPLIKVSISTYAKLDAELLPVGAAVGEGVGPKLIASKKYCLDDLPQLRVAIPGRETTAHLLLQRLGLVPKSKRFCLFTEVANLIRSGEVDAGLIIHESRFTFEDEGFIEISDLGDLWDGPLPLGGLVMQKGHPLQKEVVQILQRSFDYAEKNLDEIMPYILKHAQYPDVAQEHIECYVTDQTRQLSPAALTAIERLTNEKTVSLCSLP